MLFRSAEMLICLGGKIKDDTLQQGVDIEVKLAKKSGVPVALVGTVGGRSSEYAFELLKQGKWENINPWGRGPCEIPKDNGKKRMLGIPTAVDRVIQQAIAQVLTPIYEAEFVETSYGFRPGKSAHDAIRKCQEYLNEGYVWAVDMDLEKFFDTVNQSKLMEILSKKIKDGRVISLIHK